MVLLLLFMPSRRGNLQFNHFSRTKLCREAGDVKATTIETLVNLPAPLSTITRCVYGGVNMWLSVRSTLSLVTIPHQLPTINSVLNSSGHARF